MNNSIEVVLKIQNKLGEGPIWNPDNQTLYWLDIHQQRIESYDPANEYHRTVFMDLAITVLGLRARGGFVIASNCGIGFWDGFSQAPTLVGHPEADKPYNRFNDGAVDPAGRFWAGTMYEGPQTDNPTEGSLFRFDSDHSIHMMEGGLTICNGIGWSPDYKIMYFTDTLRRVIYSYEYDQSSGTITNRQTLFQAHESDGYPDGLTVDEQGFVWSAFWGGWKVCRFDPTGQLERTILLPVECPTSIAFGGKDLNDLYITTAWTALSLEQRHAQPHAGDLFRIRQDIHGLPENKFLG